MGRDWSGRDRGLNIYIFISFSNKYFIPRRDLNTANTLLFPEVFYKKSISDLNAPRRMNKL